MTLLPMENRESILGSLKSFDKEKPIVIPPVLEDYIKQIARTGQTLIPWIYIKPLLLQKFNRVIDEFVNDDGSSELAVSSAIVSELRERVYDTLKRLNGIPFTIQRMCELLESPFKHYSRVDKYLRGFEKVCMVVSTVDPHGNKIHFEDPRFPSRAGLDECNLIINDVSISPPSSPSIYELRRQQPSRSSDEEATDDDENEDEEDVGTEGSSHDSGNSPRIVHSLEKSPVPTSTSSGSWLLGTKSPIDPGSSNLRVQDFPLGEVGVTSQNPFSLATPLDEFSGKMLVDDSGENLTELNKSESESSSSPDKESRLHDLSDHSGLFSPPPCTDDADEHNRSISPQLNSPEISVERPTTDVIKAGWSNKSPEVGLSSHEDPSTGSGESVPPIVHILRPIGQLEAFVQNVVPDISPPSTSLSSVPVTSSDASIPVDSEFQDSKSSSGSSDDLLTESDSEEREQLTPGTKRRNPSYLSDQLSEDSSSNVLLDVAVEEFQQSPAKRRRLADTTVSSAETEGMLSGSQLGALNGSPPIIICNSFVANRDRDSGEQTRSVSSSSAVSVTESEAADDGNSSHLIQPPEATSHAQHIDSETGELSER